MFKKIRDMIVGQDPGSNSAPASAPGPAPYRNQAFNVVYNLLFCDDLNLFRGGADTRPEGPWIPLFAEHPDIAALRAIADDASHESRLRVLAYNRLRAIGETVPAKILLGVVVEVGLEKGLDVLAAFVDRRARYINESEKMSVFESPLPDLEAPITSLLVAAQTVVDKIGPWNKPRLPPPINGNIRMNFLVSDGLYFGQGPIADLQQDAVAGPVIAASVALLRAVIDQTLQQPAGTTS